MTQFLIVNRLKSKILCIFTLVSLSINVDEIFYSVTLPPHGDPALPDLGSAEEEHHNSLSIFLVLVLLGICILLIHVMLKFKFHYVPESVAVILIGKHS